MANSESLIGNMMMMMMANSERRAAVAVGIAIIIEFLGKIMMVLENLMWRM
jgi:hypothetical protein